MQAQPSIVLRRNVLANYLGQAWVALMGLAFVPVYVRHLGMEAYGLVGLFAMFQASLTLLDLGMTPTLGREMARFAAGQHDALSIRRLLRSLEFVCLGIASLTCAALWAASGWLAAHWLKVDQLPVAVVESAVVLMAVVVALRLVEGIYRSALFGLQRQVWYNAVNASLATLRGVGAVVVLVAVSSTIQAFFVWQALVSLATIAVFGTGVHRALPAATAPVRFSAEALLGIWRYAGGMSAITLLAVLLTQVDKLLLSRLLPLEAFGQYTFAAMIAGALYLVVTPITTALFPRLVELVSRADPGSVADTYHRSARWVTVVTAPAALLLALHGADVLFAWSGDVGLARDAGQLLSALALGTFLNGLMYVPYQLQLAHGWTALALRINLAAVVLLVPAILWVVPRHGAIGAACVWIALNASYVIVGIQLMHRRLLPAEKWRWYVRDVGAPAAAAGIALLLGEVFAPQPMQQRLAWVAYLLVAGALGFVAAGATVVDFRALFSLRFRRAASS